ncbi:hypothetical protein [Jeotgalibacillus haloalkalitolerans]|uniref:Uncharacterized protein n=1 Tax=Jeotgalibacillus haloalkalitolerans TaxID=3104292 RepID=A0ABU5KNE7_9BACL|nr:hypothetical protein [Jeotgalibacillus sp. HH7-29]MDZ5712788.1 hypothetical protein [Jeotgalibacillus sp. HH7-29]
MSKKRLQDIQKEMDKLQATGEDIELQVKMLKSQAHEKRQERYSLMKKDFAKNKEEIFKLDKEEKELWDSVNSLNDFKEELEKEKEEKTKVLVFEAVEIRSQMEKKLKEDQQKVIQDLLKKKYMYLVEIEKTVKKNRSKNAQELEEVNEFILEYGNAKMLPRGQYTEKTLSIETGYGRKNLPSHMVSSDDYSTLFGREDQQNFSYRLFKETGEIELDSTQAQKKLRELKK